MSSHFQSLHGNLHHPKIQMPRTKKDKKQDFSEIFSLCLACVVLRNHRLPKMAMHGCFVAGITLEKNNIFFQGWYVTKKQALQIGVNKCNLFAGRRVVHNRY